MILIWNVNGWRDCERETRVLLDTKRLKPRLGVDLYSEMRERELHFSFKEHHREKNQTLSVKASFSDFDLEISNHHQCPKNTNTLSQGFIFWVKMFSLIFWEMGSEGSVVLVQNIWFLLNVKQVIFLLFLTIRKLIPLNN